MTDCATRKMHFETETALTLEAAFDGGRITSDGGLLCRRRRIRSWVCARPSQNTCRSSARGKGAAL
jgi:hypothetical protein